MVTYSLVVVDMYAECGQEFCIMNMHTQNGIDSHEQQSRLVGV